MKLNPADSKPISGLLMTKLMQHDHDSMAGDVGEDNKLNLTKVYEEIDQLEEFNRTTTGLTTVNVGSKNETKSLNSIDLLPQQQDLLYLCLKSHVGRKQKNHSKLIENYLTQLLNHYNQLKVKKMLHLFPKLIPFNDQQIRRNHFQYISILIYKSIKLWISCKSVCLYVHRNH